MHSSRVDDPPAKRLALGMPYMHNSRRTKHTGTSLVLCTLVASRTYSMPSFSTAACGRTSLSQLHAEEALELRDGLLGAGVVHRGHSQLAGGLEVARQVVH